jgi:hypothetical protein
LTGTSTEVNNYSMAKITDAYRQLLIKAAVLFGCVSSAFIVLQAMGFHGEWYNINTLMTDPTALPIFGHRLFFVGIAKVFKLAAPQLSNVQCYFASQFLALVFAFVAVERLCAEVVSHRWSVFAYPTTLALLVPTIGYFTFYDIGIIGFFALSLLLIAQHRYGLYLVVFTLGVLNHENIILLAPVAIIEAWHSGRRGGCLALALAQLLLYGSVRAILFFAFPMPRAFNSKIWLNLHPFQTYSMRGLALSAAALLFWWLIVVIAWKSAPKTMRYAAATLWPGLVMVTALFGKWIEPRQFVAFIPVCVVVMLAAVVSGETSTPEFAMADARQGEVN